MLSKLSELIDIAQLKPTKKIAVVSADDIQVLEAIKIAESEGLINPILIGNVFEISRLASILPYNLSNCELLPANNPEEAANIAASLINNGKADILMKGFISTTSFLKAILNHDHGIDHQRILNHLALMEIPTYHKLLAITDVAFNINPILEEKAEIIRNSIRILQMLGIEHPKVAVLCPVELVNPKIESTIHAALLVKMNTEGKISNCIIEGPYSLDNAISKKSAKHKNIVGKVAGNADLLLCPGLDAGNVLYKSLIYFANAKSASIVTGASVPIVLTSRSDSVLTKLYSIALACSLK